jgi:hypothetical protein
MMKHRRPGTRPGMSANIGNPPDFKRFSANVSKFHQIFHDFRIPRDKQIRAVFRRIHRILRDFRIPRDKQIRAVYRRNQRKMSDKSEKNVG